MAKERILITVKTYPTLSSKYGETVCTAGIREDGTWVRIYPVPFRRLNEDDRYAKYDWLECTLIRNHRDPRPETFKVDEADLSPVGRLSTENNWAERRRLLLQTARVYSRLDELIAGAKTNTLSLAVFKPHSVDDFKWEKEDPNWDSEKLRKMRDKTNQFDLFDDNSWRDTFRVIDKLPFSFSYSFTDVTGRKSELQILDWEIGQLYWNCRRAPNSDDRTALAKVRQKYFDEFRKKDLHFYLGTTQQFHSIAPNPWVIIGVLPIPHEKQLSLF